MDATTIARVLWAATRDLDSENAAVASQARQALANLLATGAGRGFPPPLEPSAQDLSGAAWKACSAAAGAAAPAGAPGFALLAPLQAPGGTDLDHGLAWPGAPGSTRVARIGPLRRKDDARDWYLETYSGIDSQAALRGNGDSRPGLYARIPVAAPDIAPRTPPGRRAYAQSYLLFLAAVALALASVGLTYVASRVADGTVGRVVVAEADPCAVALAASRETGDRVEAVRLACTPAWEAAWTEETRASDTAGWTERLGRTAWRIARVGEGASLIAPLLLSYAAVLVLILAGGLATTGTWFGALVDNRNRVSLSRVQMLAWTVVLLGGYVVVGTFNVALLGSAVRDLTLNAGSWGAASTTTLRDFAGFFPDMDPALWAALGLTAVVSPFLSQMILNRKATAGGERIEARPLVPSATLETRERLDQSRWSDLVTGEEEANAGQVDVSRLQYLVITFMLLGSYLILLLRYLGTLEGTQILIAAHDHAPVFPSMPPVDGTFLALLALSHGGYLAFKVLPSAGAGGVTG